MARISFERWLEPRAERTYAGYKTHCWLWRKSLRADGYGQVCALRWTGHIKKVRAHRLCFEKLIGPIPDGLTLDHLCRNPACVNPAHLEPVTQGINSARAQAAKRGPGRLACGHEDAPENRVAKGKVLCCRTCHNRRQRAYNARQRERRLLAHEDNVLRGKFAKVKAA